MRRYPVRSRTTSLAPAREGIAAVELALVLPLFAAIMLGMFEFGRAVMVKEILSNAARKGARTAALPGRDNATVEADVNAVLSSHGLDTSKATIVTLVNDLSADVKMATAGDKVSVRVSLPFSAASWTKNFLLTNTSLASETLSMMRQ